MGKFCCPNCGSDNIESVQFLYEEGHITTKETRREVVGYDHNTRVTTYSDGSTKEEHIGYTPIYGNVERTVVKKTMLANRIEPPQKPVRKERKKFWFEKIIDAIFSLYKVYSGFVLFGAVASAVLYFLFNTVVYSSAFASQKLIGWLYKGYYDGAFTTINWFSTGIYGMPFMFLVQWLISKIPFVVNGEREMDYIYEEECKKYKELYDKWCNSYVCRKCYNIFTK